MLMNFEHFEGASVGYQKSSKRKNEMDEREIQMKIKDKRKLEVKLFDTSLCF